MFYNKLSLSVRRGVFCSVWLCIRLKLFIFKVVREGDASVVGSGPPAVAEVRSTPTIADTKRMKRLTYALLVAILVPVLAVVWNGCGRAEGHGKLQVMYSGNIRGNISPCG